MRPETDEPLRDPFERPGTIAVSGNEDVLQRSLFGPFLLVLYSLTLSIGMCPLALGSRSMRSALLRLVLRLEGGDFYSQTGREIMRRFHGVEIGAYSYGCFNPDHIPANVTIGRYVSIGPGVKIFLHDHPVDRLSTHPFFYNSRLGHITADAVSDSYLVIGSDVWIGANVVIVAGCNRIGDGAVVGAGSIVTRTIPDFYIAAGVPAKPIGERFPKALAAQVKGAAWWEKPLAEFLPHMETMSCSLVSQTDAYVTSGLIAPIVEQTSVVMDGLD
jgi:virginiamycin A acetyltransferase